MKKLLFILLLTATLPSCITTAALVTGATVGGAIIYDNRSTKTMFEDRHITVLAQKMINRDSVLKHKVHVSVATLNHVVLLVGQAPTPALRSRVIALVKAVPKVKRIYNQIEIGAPSSMLTRSSDSVITAKVKTVALGKAGLKQTNNLKVITENGVVYLMGLTVPSEGKLLADIARKATGVQRVVKVFEYMH